MTRHPLRGAALLIAVAVANASVPAHSQLAPYSQPAEVGAAEQLVAAVRAGDRSAFARLVAPTATTAKDRRFTIRSLARLARRCQSAVGGRLGISDEAIIHWVCPTDDTPQMTVLTYRDGRVVRASTEPAVIYALPSE